VALENSSRRQEVLLLLNKVSSVQEADLRDMFRKFSKCLCTSTVMVSPDPLSPTPSISSAVKTPGNTDE
jgi:hypothetical protein